RSSPLIPGRRTSTTRHAGPSAGGSLKNSCADPNDRTTRPTDLKRLSRAARMEASSSTTNTVGPAPLTACSSRLRPTAAPWWNDDYPPILPGPCRPVLRGNGVGLFLAAAIRNLPPREGGIGGEGRDENSTAGRSAEPSGRPFAVRLEGSAP